MIKRHKKLFIFLIFVGLIVGGVISYIALNATPEKLTDEEREQAVADILGRKPNLNPDVKTGDTSYESEYISFEYPAQAVQYDYVDEGKENNSTEVDSFSFDIENPRLILNYTAVERPDTSSLDDIPAVKLREDTTRGYEKEEVLVDSVTAFSFSKPGGGSIKAEKSVFILSGGVLYSISITGSHIDDVDELFEQVINSTRFK